MRGNDVWSPLTQLSNYVKNGRDRGYPVHRSTWYDGSGDQSFYHVGNVLYRNMLMWIKQGLKDFNAGEIKRTDRFLEGWEEGQVEDTLAFFTRKVWVCFGGKKPGAGEGKWLKIDLIWGSLWVMCVRFFMCIIWGCVGVVIVCLWVILQVRRIE